jgi:signal peptidase II
MTQATKHGRGSPRGNNLKWLWLSAAVLLLDQATKYLAESLLDLHRPVGLLPFLNLTLTYNTGAAFSLLSGAGGWQRWLFIVLAIVITVVLALWLRRASPGDRWLVVGLSLVLGGALGNLWDRLTVGAVVDFIDVHYLDWHWPAFNVADSAICIGAVMLIVSTFKYESGKGREAD